MVHATILNPNYFMALVHDMELQGKEHQTIAKPLGKARISLTDPGI